MFHIHDSSPWSPRRQGASPPAAEETWLDRRRLLALLGLGGLAAACSPALGGDETDGLDETLETPGPRGYTPSDRWVPSWEPAGGRASYPAERNPAHDPGRPLTPEDACAEKNNFYEFLPGRAGEVHRLVGDFKPRPWTIQIAGEVEEERTVGLDELAGIAPLEERSYRFRCVERWSMTVPWTGLSMAEIVRWCKPTSQARFVRFISFKRPAEAPGQRPPNDERYPWPYYEGLRMDEALHPLTLMATGIFGHGLPAQHGAPLRLVVPWKYGYKSPKSIVRIEFTRTEPGTFWSDLSPREYPFLSNVDPAVPHPRWSQAEEHDLASGDRRPTQPYNGYAESVASLYR